MYPVRYRCNGHRWYVAYTVRSRLFWFVIMIFGNFIGYGYQSPTDDSSRLFTIFVILFGVFGVYGLINNAVVHRLETLNRRAGRKNKNMSEADLYRMHLRRMSMNVFSIISSLFIAAGIFALLEDWTFIRGLYFVIQTASVSNLIMKARSTVY